MIARPRWSRGRDEERPQDVVRALTLPAWHHVVTQEDVPGPRLTRILIETYERQPRRSSGCPPSPGVGAKTVHALSLAAEVMYGVPARHSRVNGL